jgi:hypothetical protein
MFDFLRAIGLKPLEWSQAIGATGEATPYIGQVLDTAFTIAQAVVVLMTPDDVACLRVEIQTEQDPHYEKQPTGQARPNVLFEAGMAMGRNPKRTVLVEIGTLRPFSDVGGRHVLRLNNSSERRHDLAQRLQTAGCAVDLTGRDWHTVGSFDLKPAPPSAAERVLDNSADQPGESRTVGTRPVQDWAALEIIDAVNKLPPPAQAVLFEAFIHPKAQSAELEASGEWVEYLWQDCGFLVMLADGKTFSLKPDIYKALIDSKWGERS